MSERRPALQRPGLAPVFALLLLAPPARGDAGAAAAILARADGPRSALSEARMRLRVTTSRTGASAFAGEFTVLVKGPEKLRIEFAAPEDRGKLLLVNGKNAWLILPGTKNPIKVPRSHRVTGGFAVADVARTRFVDDYDAVVERSDTFGGRLCDVLRLTGKKGRDPAFPVLRVWVDREEGRTRKIVFLLPSGKTAREATFDEWGSLRGAPTVTRMTIVDALRPGTTLVEYLDAEKAVLDDALFAPPVTAGAPGR
ncbi:MAG: outer membrane lipoprotein-sorting protein [Holophagales bacterium]|jgi:outer membrane lipoprotein-sorting protein|nr:outer membrane lipoprotein-sorting protein [Holophagales bacterium]